VAVSLYFLVMGTAAGVWVSRIPAVKQQAHLSDGALGAALFAAAVGLVAGTLAGGRLVDRFGSTRVTRAAGIGCSLLLVAPGLAGNLPELMAALLAFDLFGGMVDVGSNAQGVRLEAAYGRPVFVSLHACFSLGAIAGSLVGGAFAWAGIGPAATLAAVGVPGAFVAAVAGGRLLADRDRADRAAGTPAAAPASAAGRGQARRPAGAPARADPRGTGRLVMALGVLGICGLVGEGAAGDWSAVYLRDSLGTPAGVAALGFAAFSLTMTAGRLAGDRLAARFGAVRLVRACGLVAAAGLAGGLLSRSAVGGVAGFAVFGAGLSCVAPQVFSAGGRADPARPGTGLARVVGLGYAGQATGPVLIGAVASQVGLPLALGIPVLLALWIAAAAGVLGSPRLAARGDVPTGAAVATTPP
jgi:MFS family permease